MHSFSLGVIASVSVYSIYRYIYSSKIDRYDVDKMFSNTIKCNGTFVFLSGQVGAGEGDIEEQTESALLDVDDALSLAGTDKSKIVDVTVYLSSMDDYQGMNKVYGKWLHTAPCRACVEAKLFSSKYKVEFKVTAML